MELLFQVVFVSFVVAAILCDVVLYVRVIRKLRLLLDDQSDVIDALQIMLGNHIAIMDGMSANLPNSMSGQYNHLQDRLRTTRQSPIVLKRTND